MAEKTPATFRIPEDVLNFIKQQSDEEGISQGDLIENCINKYRLEIESEEKKFMDLFAQLCDNIQSLELKRDYNNEGQQDGKNHLSEDEEKTLKFYHECFDNFRRQPFYYEPKTVV